MTASSSSYFADLRQRFPDESGLLITRAQRGFDNMHMMKNSGRPASSRSAIFEIGGTDFLIWEMDEESNRFQVFATLYNIPLGILSLNPKPSGMMVVEGFYINLAELAEHIEKHFRAAKAATAADIPHKKNDVLLFGFCKSLGHHLWNEVSGLAALVQTGMFAGFDAVIVGPFDYFNFAPLLGARGKQVMKMNANGVIVTRDRLFTYRGTVVPKEARELVLDNAASTAPATETGGKPCFCFQIRRRSRPWIKEEEKLAEIIGACAKLWPRAVFYIDGHSTSPGLMPDWQKDIEEETASFGRIKARLPGINLRSIIGAELNQKINLLKNADLFVGPIGSGGAVSSWLLRKTTICFGPQSIYDITCAQERCVPEGGSKIALVPRELIQHGENQDSGFDVDTDIILGLIRQEMEKIF